MMSPRIGFSAQHCRDALDGYLAEVDELLARVEAPNSMTVSQIAEAQDLLKNLKSCLTNDVAIRRGAGVAQMTDVERQHFEPAIRQALADFRIRVGSRPTRTWYSELYGLKITLGHARAGLQDVL